MDRSPGSGPGSSSPNHQNLINFSIFPKITGKKVITTQWTKKEIRRPMHHQGARASRGPTRLRRGDSSGRRHQPGPRKERKDQLGPGPIPSKLAPWEADGPRAPTEGARGPTTHLLRRGRSRRGSPPTPPAREAGRGRGANPRPSVVVVVSRDLPSGDRGSDHLVAQTNPPVRGRVSADRSEEAAQPLTTPRLVRKSSTDDSVRLHCMWGLRAFGRCDAGFPRRRRVPLAWAEKGRLEAVP